MSPQSTAPTTPTHANRHVLLDAGLDGAYVTIWGTQQRVQAEATRRFGTGGWHTITTDDAFIEDMTRFADARIFDADEARTAATREHAERGHLATMAAGDLPAGIHIWYDGQTREVTHVEQYPGGTGDPYALVVMRGGHVLDRRADEHVPLATADQIATTREDARRATLVTGLRWLADQFEAHRLPLPPTRLRVSGHLGSPEQLDLAAELLEVERRPADATYQQVSWEYPVSPAAGETPVVELSLTAARADEADRP